PAPASSTVSGTGLALLIFDATTGTAVGSCTTGTTCTASVTQTSATSRPYNAYVATASTTMPPPNTQASASTSVNWTSQWTATLAANNTTPVVATSVTLTATASPTVTGSPYVLSIFDATTNQLVTS